MSDTIRVFSDAWKVMVGRLPAPTLKEGDGVVTYFGNVPLLFFNLSVVERPAATFAELRGLLKTAGERAAMCEHPSGVVLRSDWMPAGWEAILKELGLAPLFPLTGMECDALLPPRRPPAALEIRRVADAATARDLAVVNAHAYPLPEESMGCICNMRLYQADTFGFVGYAEGKPVTSAVSFPAAGTVYIALVATEPEAQGKGYAETVMRRAVTEGRRAMGTLRTTLHASDMGMPLYRSMGYAVGPKLILVGKPE